MIKQRLHVKKKFKKFLNSIKLFLLFSAEIFSTKYRDVRYRDVAYVPRCPDTGRSAGNPIQQPIIEKRGRRQFCKCFEYKKCKQQKLSLRSVWISRIFEFIIWTNDKPITGNFLNVSNIIEPRKIFRFGKSSQT